jgi:tetrahydromethanopterin S-methyltransferase subunit G
MASDVTRSEFQQMEARVSVVEGEVEGEKLVSRYILEQTRRNGDDLAAVKSRLDRLEKRLDGVDGRLDGVEGRLGRVEGEVRQLRQDLPAIVADTMREVLRERDGG